MQAYGTIDELSSFIGLALSHLPEQDGLVEELLWVQRILFQVASLLAFPGQEAPGAASGVDERAVACLESAIDRLEGELPPLTAFILPGGGTKGGAAFLHCARAICRRAERQCAAIDFMEYPPLGGVHHTFCQPPQRLFVLRGPPGKHECWPQGGPGELGQQYIFLVFLAQMWYIKWQQWGGSSNGRTDDSDSSSLGSNPSPPAICISLPHRCR